MHANAEALEAVLTDVAAAGISRGVVTGDLVMRGPEPEAVVARVRSLGWPCVAGNTDRKVARRPERDPAHRKAGRAGSRAWTVLRLSDRSLAYLTALPVTLELSLGAHRVAVVHDPALAPEGFGAGADGLLAGHSHRPEIARVGACLRLNPGSVGEAVGADRRPSWAWVEWGGDRLRAVLARVDRELARPRDD